MRKRNPEGTPFSNTWLAALELKRALQDLLLADGDLDSEREKAKARANAALRRASDVGIN